MSSLFFSYTRRPRSSTLFPYTTLFRSPIRLISTTCSILASSVRATVLPVTTPAFATTTSISPNRSTVPSTASTVARTERSEEHTSELQSRENLVCRLLLEKKKQQSTSP